jgi:hypothetical protein
MLKKRTPVAERRRETRDSYDRRSAGCRDITGRISALVAGPVRVLTWAGEPLNIRDRGPGEP